MGECNCSVKRFEWSSGLGKCLLGEQFPWCLKYVSDNFHISSKFGLFLHRAADWTAKLSNMWKLLNCFRGRVQEERRGVEREGEQETEKEGEGESRKRAIIWRKIAILAFTNSKGLY